MIKTLILTAALAGMAPAAEAGGLDVRLFFGGQRHSGIGVGIQTHRRARTRRAYRPSHARPAHRVWRPAYSERVSHRVWIPARHRRGSGHYQTRYRTVRHAGRYETRRRARHSGRRRSRRGH